MADVDPNVPDPDAASLVEPTQSTVAPRSNVTHETSSVRAGGLTLPHSSAERNGRYSTIINISGYQYTKAWSSRHKVVYRCSYYRGQQCSGKVELISESMEYGNFVPHTCRRDRIPLAQPLDIVADMQAAVDDLARTEMSLPAATIWSRIDEQFYGGGQNQALVGLSREQVLSRVYRVRERHFGGNVHGRVELPPLSRVRDQPLNFFQFHYISGFDDNENPCRMIGWAHPELISLLKYVGTSIFIDGTFRCVPRGFKQCVVLMVFDRSTGYYCPVFYVLTSHRTNDTYFDVLHFIMQATDQKLDPAEVVCDFERALIDAVGVQFPNAQVIGCLFHFKQAVRRKMRKLGITNRAASIAMTPGVLDMQTVVPEDQIEVGGITWVKRQIKDRCRSDGVPYARSKWRYFWNYFKRTWLELYDTGLWNVHGLNERLVARTNNPLERFNRELNAAFSTPHPSLTNFVGTIEALARGHVADIAAIRSRRSRGRTRETIQLPHPVDLPTEEEESSNEEDDEAVDVDSDDDNEGVSGASSEVDAPADAISNECDADDGDTEADQPRAAQTTVV